MSGMDDFDLHQLESLESQATPGPWDDAAGHIAYDEGQKYLADLTFGLVGNPGRTADHVNADVNFIVAARKALPLLIAEIHRLRAENKRLDRELSKTIKDIQEYANLTDLDIQVALDGMP